MPGNRSLTNGQQARVDGLLSAKLRGRLTNVISGLLLIQFDPDFAPWYQEKVRSDLRKNRLALARALRTNPALKPSVQYSIQPLFADAVCRASVRIGRRHQVFPEKSPYSLRQIMNVNFIPRRKALPFSAYQVRSGKDIQSDWIEAGFHTSDISPAQSGLPVYVWALEKIISQNYCAIAVSTSRRTRKPRPSYDGAVIVSVSKNPRILFNGRLPPNDWASVRKFIRNNAAALRDYWRWKIDTPTLYQKLRPIVPS